MDTYPDLSRDCHAYPDADPHPHLYSHANLDGDHHADPYAHWYAYRNTVAHSDGGPRCL